MSDHLEIESSFAIADAGLEPVLGALLPWGWTVDIDGASYDVAIRKITCVLHLYSLHTRAAARERLKLALVGGELRISHEQKRPHGDDKLERIVERPRSAEAMLAAVNGYGALVSGFAKRRLALALRNHSRPRIAIAVDRVVAFDPAAPERTALPYHHLEIEAGERGAIEELTRSRWFAANLAPHVRPLEVEDTKWRLAAGLCRPDTRLTFSSFAELQGYVLAAMRAAFPQVNSLAPIS